MGNFLTGTLGKWALRRVLELGGLMTVLSQVDPTVLQNLMRTLGALVTGDFENVSVGAIIGIVGVIWGLIWNASSTFSPHVTTEGERIDTKELPPQRRKRVKDAVEPEVERRKRRTVFDMLRNR